MATLINAHEALEKVSSLEFQTVLDVGSGDGDHAAFFRDMGKEVTTVSLCEPADIVGSYTKTPLKPFDLVWCSHCLEHQPNVQTFIKKLLIDCKGYLCITVPPLKHEIVGGHVSLWNAGLLLYNLILAGQDCSQAMIKTYGYNITVIVKKKLIEMPELKMDFGDIETLAPYFPMDVRNGFNGQIEELNW